MRKQTEHNEARFALQTVLKKKYVFLALEILLRNKKQNNRAIKSFPLTVFNCRFHGSIPQEMNHARPRED